MRTGTAASRASAAEAWAPVLASAGVQGQELGEEILTLAHEVAANPLRGPLTDPGREPDDKAVLAARLFAGRMDERVVALIQALVRGRWSRPTSSPPCTTWASRPSSPERAPAAPSRTSSRSSSPSGGSWPTAGRSASPSSPHGASARRSASAWPAACSPRASPGRR